VTALVKIGERVSRGDPLCVIHANDETALAEATTRLTQAIVVADQAGPAVPLIADVII